MAKITLELNELKSLLVQQKMKAIDCIRNGIGDTDSIQKLRSIKSEETIGLEQDIKADIISRLENIEYPNDVLTLEKYLK